MAKWLIQLKGGFELVDPEGRLVPLARKSAGVLAMLALSDRSGVPRADLAKALWPKVEAAKQSTSLRQELHALRERLGEASFFNVNRDRCWLNWQEVECPDAAEPFTGDMLPEFQEPWFRRKRQARTDASDDQVERVKSDWLSVADAASALLQVFEWASIYQPSVPIELAKLLPELVASMASRDVLATMKRAIETVTEAHPLYGWARYNMGLAYALRGDMDKANEEYSIASVQAAAHHDALLMVNVVFYHAANQIVEGHPQVALQTLASISSAMDASTDFMAAVRYHHGMGLARMHNGEFADGLKHLLHAIELFPAGYRGFEHAYTVANTAWMTSTSGYVSVARQHLNLLRRLPAGRSWRLVYTGLLAESQIAYESGDYDQAIKVGQHCIHLCEMFETKLAQLYAIEIVALAQMQLGQGRLAEKLMRESKKGRQQGLLGYTAWDRHRLREFTERFGPIYD